MASVVPSGRTAAAFGPQVCSVVRVLRDTRFVSGSTRRLEAAHYRGNGADSPYVTTNAPGFAGEAVDWLFNARSILATGSDTLGPDATIDETLQATTRTLLHGGITLENVGPGLSRMRPHGDWIAVNGNRPAFSGFQMGFTGFTGSHRSGDPDSAART
jgi:hypothetical protein